MPQPIAARVTASPPMPVIAPPRIRDEGPVPAVDDDAAARVPQDTAHDAGRDAWRDAGRDGGPDAGRDAGRDGGPDAGRDAGRDTGPNTGRDTGPNTGRDGVRGRARQVPSQRGARPARRESGDPARGAARRGARRRIRRPSRREVLVVVGAVVVVAASAVVLAAIPEPPAPEELTLSEALAVVQDGRIDAAVLNEDARRLVMTDADGAELEAAFPAAYVDELTEILVAAGVDVDADVPGPSLGETVLQRVLPILLIVGLLLLLVRRLNPAAPTSGRTKALTTGETPRARFADVAGADEAVDQLQEMVDFLRDPARFEAVGATRPRGALLVGPPGTGKTLLARAVAGEAGVPFFAIAGSDFMETFVGVGARRVRDLFAQARKAERAIIFIDEVDAVGRARSSGAHNGGDGERENTLISLLNEMDGFAGSHVVVLAATNRPDTLDPALTRPGRLDRQVQVPNPDRRGRTLILGVHSRRRPLGPDVDLVQVARQTPGMSGADLEQVVNEACMEAVRRGRTTVDAECFQAAIATVAMGRARTSALVTDFDREITAWHEAGHTLAASLLPDADDPVSVTIVPRGPAGGATWMSGNDDVFLPRRKALAQLTVALAGRAAEEYLLDGEHTQGASSDLQGATRLATAMVTQYGMTDFGYAQLDAETMRVGGAVAARAHDRIDGLLRDAHGAATTLLAEYAAALEALAAALLAEETLSGVRVAEIVGAHRHVV